MNGPPHCSRSQAMSAQVGGGVSIHSPYTEERGRRAPGAAMLGTVRSGRPPYGATRGHNRAGDALRGEPEQGPQVYLLRYRRAAPVPAVGERPVQGDDQALGAGLAGALRALRRSRPSCLTSRSGRTASGLASATRSTGMLPNELRPIAVPASAVPLATPASPSGCTACTPVGDAITGSAISCPSTDVARSRAGGQVGDARRREPQVTERRQVVLQRDALFGARHQRHVHRPRQAPPCPPARLLDRLEPLAVLAIGVPPALDRVPDRLFCTRVP